jgi:hypothetical protein
MANRYGEAALIAARSETSARVDPAGRWESAVEKLYPTSPIARKKGSPRGAFLGLCEAGLVKGIPAGEYTKSKANKSYAVDAAHLLAQGTKTWSTSELWREVTRGADKAHDHQMDIVMALWKNNLLTCKP